MAKPLTFERPGAEEEARARPLLLPRHQKKKKTTQIITTHTCIHISSAYCCHICLMTMFIQHVDVITHSSSLPASHYFNCWGGFSGCCLGPWVFFHLRTHSHARHQKQPLRKNKSVNQKLLKGNIWPTHRLDSQGSSPLSHEMQGNVCHEVADALLSGDKQPAVLSQWSELQGQWRTCQDRFLKPANIYQQIFYIDIHFHGSFFFFFKPLRGQEAYIRSTN